MIGRKIIDYFKEKKINKIKKLTNNKYLIIVYKLSITINDKIDTMSLLINNLNQDEDILKEHYEKEIKKFNEYIEKSTKLINRILNKEIYKNENIKIIPKLFAALTLRESYSHNIENDIQNKIQIILNIQNNLETYCRQEQNIEKLKKEEIIKEEYNKKIA